MLWQMTSWTAFIAMEMLELPVFYPRAVQPKANPTPQHNRRGWQEEFGWARRRGAGGAGGEVLRIDGSTAPKDRKHLIREFGKAGSKARVGAGAFRSGSGRGCSAWQQGGDAGAARPIARAVARGATV
jgi:hypothetical protein